MGLINDGESFLECILSWTVIFFFLTSIVLQHRRIEKLARAANRIDPRACCFFGCHQISAQEKATAEGRGGGKKESIKASACR